MLEERDLQEAMVIELAGDIDMQSVEELSAPIFDALAGGRPHLRIDCSEVTFVESRGLTMMARAQRIAEEQGALLEWVDPPPRMLEVLRIVGMTDYLTLSITP